MPLRRPRGQQAALLLLVVLLLCCPACDTASAPSGDQNVNTNGNDNNNDNGTPQEFYPLEIAYGVQPDDPLLARVHSRVQDNEYILFANRDENGNPTALSQIHTWLAPEDEEGEGQVVVGILDDSGRPVRFEADEESATIIYDDDLAMILYAAGDGEKTVFDVALAASTGGLCGEASFVDREAIDRFDLCCLLEPYLGSVEQLFACDDGDEPTTHCGGPIFAGATAPADICEMGLSDETGDDFDDWHTDLEPQDVDAELVAAARNTPTEEGTVVHLAAVAVGVEAPGDFHWQVLDPPGAPDIPDGQTTEVLLDRPGVYTIEVSMPEAGRPPLPGEIDVIVDPLPPVARAGEDQTGQVDQSLLFDGGETHDPDGESVSYEWDFGDGSTNGSGVRVTHQYQEAGQFEVTLTVTDEDDFSDIDALTVEVQEAGAFTLTIGVEGKGNTSLPAGPNVVAANTAVVMVATPAEGWRFAGWDGDATGSNPTLYVLVNRDQEVIAVFEPVGTVSLQMQVIPNGAGSITVNPLGDPPYTYMPGTELTVEAMANPSWVFSRYDGVIVSTNGLETFTIESDSTLIAIFEEGQTFNLTTQVTPPDAGMIMLNPPGGVYAAGSVVTLFAVPAANYEFERFTEDGATIGTSGSATVIMDRDHTVVAEFTSTISTTAITQQPQPAAIACSGYDAGFSITAAGTDLAFIWLRDCDGDLVFEPIPDNAHFDIISVDGLSWLCVYAADASDVPVEPKRNTSALGGEDPAHPGKSKSWLQRHGVVLPATRRPPPTHP